LWTAAKGLAETACHEVINHRLEGVEIECFSHGRLLRDSLMVIKNRYAICLCKRNRLFWETIAEATDVMRRSDELATLPDDPSC
jgi:hypothetical protein